MSAKQVAIAIANKIARIAWATWSTAASTRPAIAPPNIERRRARLPDKRLGDGVIAAAAAHDQRQSERNTP
jgi:hypothetical protein